MPRRNKRHKQYGQPTEMISVRVPVELHRKVKEHAKRDRMPKSRKVVEILTAALHPPVDGGLFD